VPLLAETAIRAGIARVTHQEPLEHDRRAVSTDVLVIGGGPAGHKAALTLAEAGRHVTLAERSAILGGLPVRIEDLYPAMECAPCLLEPLTGELLHGELPGPIDVLLLSQVTAVKGSLGNFTVTIRREPRYVTDECVGCGDCVTACPVAGPNPLNLGRTERKAIDFELYGGLPSIAVLDDATCRRFVGTAADDADCTACRSACPLDDVIRFDDRPQELERNVGAIAVAVGAQEYDAGLLPGMGHGSHPDVMSAWEFERLLAANGPTGGRLLTHDGRVPERIAVVNCAGSLDDAHVPYCSGTCCGVSFKLQHLIRAKSPGTEVVCFCQQLVAPGKDGYDGYRHARDDAATRWVRYDEPAELAVRTGGSAPAVVRALPGGGEEAVRVRLGGRGREVRRHRRRDDRRPGRPRAARRPRGLTRPSAVSTSPTRSEGRESPWPPSRWTSGG
jgi:heterodisulfide reductase subunit A